MAEKNILERQHTTIQHDAVPIVAADTVVTKHLKIVDDAGNVRAEIAVDAAVEQGPRLRLFDRDGCPLVELSITDGAEGQCGTALYMADQHVDNEVLLSVGSLRGPIIAISHKDGVTVRVGAESSMGFIESSRVGAETVMQLVPGEEPETFIEGAVDESEVAS